MKIITDTGMDAAPERLEGFDIQVVPLTITLGENQYQDDIPPTEFYRLVRETGLFPTTSQPSPADFKEVYLRAAQDDPNIISIHMSSQLSGTYNAARLGAAQAMEEGNANITVIDSYHVSGALGWMVEAAARAAAAGWARDDIVKLVERVGDASVVLFSPETMRYLVHGGRVSHLRGFAATMLNIKPVLQLTHATGKVENLGTVRTFKKAIAHQLDFIAEQHGEGASLRVQVEHADNTKMADYLHGLMADRFDCHFLPDTVITPLLGAHTGPGLVGVVYAPKAVIDEIP